MTWRLHGGDCIVALGQCCHIGAVSARSSLAADMQAPNVHWTLQQCTDWLLQRHIHTHRHPPRTCDRQLVHHQQPNGLPAAGPRITTPGQCSHVLKQECLHLFGQSRSTPGCFGAHAECTGSTQRLHTATSPTCDCRLVHEQQPNGLPAAADTRPEALLIV